MGCFWSRQGRENCRLCFRRAVDDTTIVNYVCDICISAVPNTRDSPPGPKFGEYRCNGCQRSWNSRWCWPDKYQMCKRCKKPTLPYEYRDLQPTDIAKSNESGQEHVGELCQMCQQLGYSCKDFGKQNKPPVPNNSRTTEVAYTTTYYKKW